MIEAHRLLWNTLDTDAMQQRAMRFHEIERPMGLTAWKESAAFARAELERAGIETSILDMPVDGQTVALDHVMPPGWDCTFAALDMAPHGGGFERLVDTESEPLCIGPFSPATPPEGLIGRVVAAHAADRNDWRNAFVLSVGKPEGGVRQFRHRLEASGAYGALCAWSALGREHATARQFINYFTSGAGWYPTADEPPLIHYSLSLAEADRIHTLLNAGPVTVRALIRGTRDPDTLPIVSGILRGTHPEEPEVLAVAHIYEPLLTDDATGAAAVVELISVLQQAIASGTLSAPRRTIRVLLPWEQYGLAYFFERMRAQGGRLLTLTNLDDCGQACPGVTVEFVHSAHTLPWGGDAPWLTMLQTRFSECLGTRYPTQERLGHMGDDCFLSHPAYGVPSYWVRNSSGAYHHSSALSPRHIDPDLFRFSAAAAGAYLHGIAAAGEAETVNWSQRLQQEAEAAIPRVLARQGPEQAAFEAAYHAERIRSLQALVEPDGLASKRLDAMARAVAQQAPAFAPNPNADAARRKAARLMVDRPTPENLPWDLARLPRAKRIPLGLPIKGTLAWCDGKRTLAEAMRAFELEYRRSLGPEDVDRLLNTIVILQEAGYLRFGG